MEIIICKDCGAHFEPEHAKMRVYCDEQTGYQGYKSVCPYCNSEEIYDGIKCESCGEFFLDEDISRGMCFACEIKLQNALNAFISRFNDAELEYLDYYAMTGSD
jgi:hypothetical protein